MRTPPDEHAPHAAACWRAWTSGCEAQRRWAAQAGTQAGSSTHEERARAQVKVVNSVLQLNEHIDDRRRLTRHVLLALHDSRDAKCGRVLAAMKFPYPFADWSQEWHGVWWGDLMVPATHARPPGAAPREVIDARRVERRFGAVRSGSSELPVDIVASRVPWRARRPRGTSPRALPPTRESRRDGIAGARARTATRRRRAGCAGVVAYPRHRGSLASREGSETAGFRRTRAHGSRPGP